MPVLALPFVVAMASPAETGRITADMISTVSHMVPEPVRTIREARSVFNIGILDVSLSARSSNHRYITTRLGPSSVVVREITPHCAISRERRPQVVESDRQISGIVNIIQP
jgi:hypothetical protein